MTNPTEIHNGVTVLTGDDLDRAISEGRAATCGWCGRSWDDTVSTTYTPAPAGRCPFEHLHDDPDPSEPPYDLSEALRGLSENQAVQVFNNLARRFNWAGTIFTRNDLTAYNVDEDNGYVELPLTDEQWLGVQDDYLWRHGITDLMVEAAQDALSQLVDAVSTGPESDDS